MKTIPIKLNLLPVALIISAATILTACSNTTMPSSATNETSTITKSASTSLPKPESLNEILARAALITQVSYDMFSREPGGQVMDVKFWIKGKQARLDTTNEGTAVVMILNIDTLQQFICLPSKKMASQSKYDSTDYDLTVTPDQMASYILKSNPIMTGSESYDGKDCAIVEYTDQDGKKLKGWIWKARGLLLKTVSQGAERQEFTEVSNVSFLDIPDSLFKLPADVRMVAEEELYAAFSPPEPQPQTQTQALTGQYKSPNWGYSISYPEGWAVDDSDPAVVQITNVQAWVFISMFKNQTLSLEDWLEVGKSVFTKYSDYQELASEMVALSDGTPAYVVLCKYTENGKAHQEIKVLAVTKNSCLSLTASATDTGWPKYGDTLEKIIDSLIFQADVAPTSPPTTSGTLYSNPAWNYSITVLDGWTVDDKDKAQGHLIIWSPDHGGLMEVFAQNVPGANLDVYLNDLISRYRSTYAGFQEISRQKISLSGGLPAYALLSTRNNSAQPEKELAIMTVAGSRQVQVYARTWLQSWDAYSSGFEKIAYSLTVTSPK